MSVSPAPEPRERPAGDDASGAPDSPGGLRVLLVEDNPGERWLFSEILRSRGHTVVACEDAETAWEAYRDRPTSLALLDWILPEMDGLELCRRIRESPGGDRTVVVVVTGRNDPEALETVLAAGADDYVSKPVDVALMNVRLAVAENVAGVRADHARSQETLKARTREIEALFENLDQVFFSIDVEEDRLIQVSSAAREVLGMDADRLREDPELWREHLYPPMLGEVEPGEPHAFQHPYQHPDGTERWLETRLVRSAGAEGGSPRIYGMVSDATGRKRAEEGLSERNEELMTLYRLSEITLNAHASGDAYDEILAVISQSTGFPVVMVERLHWASERLTLVASRGLPADSGRELREIPVHESLSGTAARTGEPVVEPDARRRPEHTHEALRRLDLRTWLSFPLVVEGRVTGALTLADHDVREPDRRMVRWAGSLAHSVAAHMERTGAQEALRESERRYRDLARELRSANAELEAFAYSISHDLRSPLRTMTGFAHALLENFGEDLPPGALDYARRIIASGERSEELIRDLLAYSRLTFDELEPERVELGDVVATAREQLTAAIEESGAEVEVEGPLPTVVGHETTLVQVVSNLLSNAMKFVPDDRKPRIRVRARADDPSVRLWVEDNGIGIPEDQRERIFRVFERLAVAEAVPGTGIGLAIVRRGMERMRGTAGVEPRDGEDGSSFWIEIPRARSEGRAPGG